MVIAAVAAVMSCLSCLSGSDWFLTVSALDSPRVGVPLSDKSHTLGAPILSTYRSRLPEGQVSGGGSAETGDEGMVDLSGLTLADLRDLRDGDDKSSLTRALSRVLAGEADGHHSFSACI